MKPFASYQNPALATDLVVFGYQNRELAVLLLNRNIAPYQGQWTLPGAFVQIEESFADTCARVLDTKLGMSKVFLEQLYSFDTPGRDPRGRVVTVAYYALINPHRLRISAGAMAHDVKWFPIANVPELGFDHTAIFNMALQRLRAKILYQPIGFELLDETFTMTELQDLYECILGVALDRRNFRKKILESEYVLQTTLRREGLQHRPADLYRFNKKLKENHFQLKIK